MNQREAIISNYITSYNEMNVAGMLKHMDDNIQFENISDGNITLSLEGIEAFRNQAQQALSYFTSRKQTITTLNHQPAFSIIDIDYEATLAIDLPNGLKKGDTLHLKGQSVFYFSGNKIVKLSDIS